MRSSKSRSRSKGNRNRSVGNIVNRVFDSSGPEGKVRGTPQQIIDKYNQLARDAQLSNDRVAAENFQQHAEHYLRMLAEALREQAERQQQNQPHQQNQGNQPQQGGQQSGDQGQGGQPNEQRNQDGNWRGGRGRGGNKPQAADQPPVEEKPAGDVIDMKAEAGGGLVETPEDKPKRQRKPRNKPQPEQAEVETPSSEPDVAPDAAE